MSSNHLRVLVAGGGIGGLCLAQALHRAGVDVTVFERAESPDAFREGYRIHIDPDGSRALHSCLPEARFALFEAACGRAPRSFAFLTEQLDELMLVDVSKVDPADPVGRHRSINRFTLRQILLDGLDGHVEFGKELHRYECAADGTVTAFFADGTRETGDVLVGAEGSGSRVRAQLLPQADRLDTGVVSIGGRLALDASVRAALPRQLTDGVAMVLASGGANMFLAPHEHTDDGAALPPHLLPPSRADYLVWAVTARRRTFRTDAAPEVMTPEAAHALTTSIVATWHDRLRRLVYDTNPATITAMTVRTAARVGPWPAGNVTVLGDAIHSMPPSRGVGANTALRDADLLGRNLVAAAADGDVTAAIADYERRMRGYGFAAVKASERALRQSVITNPIAFTATKTMLRMINTALKLKSGSRPERRLP